MFNSAGNKGNIKTAGKVQPFEVLGKRMSRYGMWQWGLADNLFIAKGCILGESEICWDPDNACFIDNDLIVSGDESAVDDLYSVSDDNSDSDCDDLDQYTPEDCLVFAVLIFPLSFAMPSGALSLTLANRKSKPLA